MNREVEERIVAMYFDNEDFEKNAKTTINTLGQLKEGLNLEDSTKGFSVFEKISKTLNFEKANTSLNKMKLNLSNIGNTFKKAFSIGKQPLDEAEGFLKHLNGYITKYIGFDVAGKIVHGLENSIRSLTIAPVTAGWHQYESTMDSIKTIMSSTGESIDVVKEHLASMTDYANKTIYSLTDMTSNLGKFTNNGVELERSVKAMEGIANATADAGQGAQQASMAMYNVSQAIGVGKMTTIDWKSLENANIATQKLKKTFLEMAALQGRIEKKTDGRGMVSYMLTKDDDGNALKESIELTTANFREYLSKGWLDKETMLRAFEVYSGQVDQLTLERWGIHDKEQQKYFIELGQDALEAATQVRTFTKMMDALKESAQSGWAKTFELIFGDMNQGTTLWTTINNILDEILSKSAEARNNMFEIWSGKEIDTSKSEEKVKEVEENLENAQQRLEALLATGTSEGIQKTIDKDLQDLQKIKDEIEELKSGDRWDKDSLIASRQKKIDEMEKGLKDLEQKRDKLAKEEQKQADRNAQKQKYQDEIAAYDKELEDLKKQQGRNRDSEGNVANNDRERQLTQKIKQKQDQIEKIQAKIRKLDGASEASEIEKLQKDIEDYEKQLGKLNKEIDRAKNTAKSSLVDEQGRTGREILIDALLGTKNENEERVGGLINLFKDIGAAISDAFGDVFGRLDAEGLFKFSQRVEEIVNKVREWFLGTNGENEENRLTKLQKILKGFLSVVKAVFNVLKAGWNLVKKLISPIADFVINALSGVYDFFVKMGDMNLGEMLTHLGEGLKTVWEKIKKLFTAREILDENGNPTGETEIPILRWLSSIWEGVKATVRQWAEDNGLGDVWTKISGWWSTIADLFEQGKAKVLEAYEAVKKWWEDNGFSKFFTDLWTGIAELFTPKTGMRYNGSMLEEYTEEAPIATFFKNIWKGIGDAFNDVKKWWEKDELGIRAFFQGIWDSIANIFTPKRIEGKQGNSWTEDMPIVAFFKNMWNGVEEVWGSVKAFWDEDKLGIKSFFQGIWDFIANIFTPKRIEGKQGNSWAEDMPIVAFFKNIWNGVEEAWTSVTDWWEKDELGIRAFFKGVWNSIVGWFTPEKDTEGNAIGDSPIVAFFNNIWNGVETAFNEVKAWWENDELGIKSFFQGVWESVSGIFKPKTGMRYNGSMLEEYTEDAPIVSFLKNMWTGVQGIWYSISSWPGWKEIGGFFEGIWTSVSGWFTNQKDGEKTGFQKFLEDVGSGLNSAWDFITNRNGNGIPWDEIGKFISDTWNWISEFIFGIEEPSGDTATTGRRKADGYLAAVQTASTVCTEYSNTLKRADKKADGAQSQNIGNKAIEFFKSILTTIGDFISQIVEAVKGVVITPEVQAFIDKISNFISGVFKVIGDIANSFGNLFNGTFKWEKDGWNVILTILTVLGGIIARIVSLKYLSNITTSTQSIGLQFLEFGAGIMLIASAISLLTTLDQERMKSGAKVIAGIALAIGVIMFAINSLVGSVESVKTGPVERFFTNVINKGAQVGMLYIIVNALPTIIGAIRDAKAAGAENIGEDLLKMAEAITLLFGGLSIILTATQLLTKGSGLNPYAALSSVLSIGAIVAVVMAIFDIIGGIPELIGYASKSENETDEEAMRRGVEDRIRLINNASEVMTALGQAIGKFIGAIQGSYEGSKDASAIEASTDVLKDVKEEDIEHMTRIMSMIGALQNGLPDYNGLLDKWINGNKLADLANQMPALGDGLSQFSSKIAGLSEDDISKMQMSIRMISWFANAMEIISKVTMAAEGQWQSGLDINSYVFEQYKEAAYLLSKAIDEALRTGYEGPMTGEEFSSLEFNAWPIIDAIINALKLGETGVAKAVRDMIQAGINLVDTPSDPKAPASLNAEQTIVDEYAKLFGDYGMTGGVSFNVNDWLKQFTGDESEYSKLMGNFEERIKGIQEKVGGFSEAFDMNAIFKMTDPDTGEETDWLTMIQGELGKLEESINETAFEVHITPVFDFQNLTAESLMSQLGLQSLSLPVGIDTGELKVNFVGLKDELDIEAIKMKLDAITSAVITYTNNNTLAVNSLGSHMDGIAAEVSRLKLWLDGKTLVGGIIDEIDTQLYDKSMMYNRP